MSSPCTLLCFCKTLYCSSYNPRTLPLYHSPPYRPNLTCDWTSRWSAAIFSSVVIALAPFANTSTKSVPPGNGSFDENNRRSRLGRVAGFVVGTAFLPVAAAGRQHLDKVLIQEQCPRRWSREAAAGCSNSRIERDSLFLRPSAGVCHFLFVQVHNDHSHDDTTRLFSVLSVERVCCSIRPTHPTRCQGIHLPPALETSLRTSFLQSVLVRAFADGRSQVSHQHTPLGRLKDKISPPQRVVLSRVQRLCQGTHCGVGVTTTF